MVTHKVDHNILRTGSRLFDLVMGNAAKKLCDDLPGLNYSMEEKVIHIYGELNDEDYKKFQTFMSAGELDALGL